MNSTESLSEQSSVFKKCSTCGFEWNQRDLFIVDPKIDVVGYQVNFEALLEGFFLFNHDCGTTLAIWAKEFKDLYDGPIFKERQTGGDACPGYCLHHDELNPCPAECECAFVREILHIINQGLKARRGNKTSNS